MTRGGFWIAHMVCKKCSCVREFVEERRIMYCEVCDQDEYVRIKYGALPKIIQPSQLQ